MAQGIQKVDVANFLGELADFLRSAWASNLRVEVRADPDLPSLLCDYLSLQTAVLNLALNARDAMPEGGALAIYASAIEQQAAGTSIEILVIDSGIGMSEQTISRAFEPFFTTKAEGLGGTGLPTVRRFAEELGGNVTIESAVGAGTKAILRLPAAFGAMD